jgi:hypothetical protein
VNSEFRIRTRATRLPESSIIIPRVVWFHTPIGRENFPSFARLRSTMRVGYLVVTLLTKKRIPEPKLTNPKPHQRSVVLLFSLSYHLTKGRPPWLASLFDAQQMIIEVT